MIRGSLPDSPMKKRPSPDKQEFPFETTQSNLEYTAWKPVALVKPEWCGNTVLWCGLVWFVFLNELPIFKGRNRQLLLNIPKMLITQAGCPPTSAGPQPSRPLWSWHKASILHFSQPLPFPPVSQFGLLPMWGALKRNLAQVSLFRHNQPLLLCCMGVKLHSSKAWKQYGKPYQLLLAVCVTRRNHRSFPWHPWGSGSPSSYEGKGK